MVQGTGPAEGVLYRREEDDRKSEIFTFVSATLVTEQFG